MVDGGVFIGGFNGRVCTQFLTTDEAAFACVTSIRLAVIDWPVCRLFVVAHLVVGFGQVYAMEGAGSNKCVNTIKR